MSNTATTNLFTFSYPDFFEVDAQNRIGFWASAKNVSFENQWPSLQVAVLKREDLESDTYAGSTWQEKFEDSCLSLYYKSEKLDAEEMVFKGYQTYVVRAHTDAAFQHTHFKITYFFACLLLDDEFYLEFRGIHEKVAGNTLANWIEEAFSSLVIIGDVKDRAVAWQQHVLDQEKEELALNQSYETVKPEKKVFTPQMPANGLEYLKIGDFTFEFIPDECKASIPDFSRMLVVDIAAKTKEHKEAIKKQLLDDYPGDGKITLQIPAKGIYENGVPTGRMVFEEGKTNAPLFLHTRFQGFDYRLDFNGTVEFKEGLLLVAGEMTKSYHNKVFPIHLAKKITINNLDWSNYQFTSLEELQTAKPETVRHIALENPDFLSLPKQFFTFKNLESLSISQRSQYYEKQKLPLNEIQKEIGTFTALKRFHLNGASVKEIPTQMGDLKNLEHLSINNCLLTNLPDGVFNLPKLSYLFVAKNQIQAIPTNIQLPTLSHIGLEHNFLKTLPESLAHQPKLKDIKLDGNPLEILPEAFNAIENIELNIADKKRLLNFEYLGADCRGLVSWNDLAYWSAYDPDLIPEVYSVIEKNKLNTYKTPLAHLVKKAIGFTHTQKEDYKEIGSHRFGGMPDLPIRIPYPRFGQNWRTEKLDYVYEFIGQVNCEAIAHLQDYLPRTGSLFFFLETMHNIYGGEKHPSKVIYVANNKELASGNRFQFEEDDYFEMIGTAYQAFKVDAKIMNSAPSLYASYVNTHLFKGPSEILKNEEDLLDDLYDTFEKPLNELNTYNYAMNNHGFTQHEAPELQASLALKGNPEDWVILLTVTSSGDMQWGDAGDIFYVIHKSDLAKQDFSKVFVTLESS